MAIRNRYVLLDYGPLVDATERPIVVHDDVLVVRMVVPSTCDT